MGKGRRPKPTAQHKLEGTFRKDRHAARAVADPARPDAPASLSDDARAEWDRVIGELAAAKLLSKLDRAVLALYCQAWADYWAAKAIVEEEGWTAVGSTGNVVEHPAVKSMHRSWEHCVRAAREFGMTPSGRAAIRVPDAPEKSTDEQALFGVVG